MSDTSGQPPADGEEGTANDPEFRDDALSELMTGAFAATSMVAMGGEGDLPAPPVWSPAEDAPKAEALDEVSGSPAQIPSGPHVRVEPEIEPEIEVDADFDEPEPGPLVAVAPATDIVVPRASDAVTVPLSGPLSGGPLGPPSVEMPSSADDYPAHLGYLDDEGEEAASISTDSGVVVTPQHAQGARLTGAYPTISPQFRSPSPRRERSSTPWVIGAAVLVGVVTIGGVVMMSGGDTTESVPAAESVNAALISPPAEGLAQPNQPETPGAPSADDPEAGATPELVDPPDEANALPAGDPKLAFAAARARYEAEPTNPGLLELTLTACALRLGPDARTAFHKLIGGKSRSKAVVKCREFGIDVTSKIEGHTGPEIANQARAALEGGDARGALALAKLSNRTERNHPALELMVLSHCQLKQKKSAKKMLRHVPDKRRPALVRDCAERGVKLRR